VARSVTGHKTRGVFDHCHIVSGTDQVEAIRRLAALQGQAAAAPSPAVITPVFNPTDFANSTAIDNPYFPLRPGTTFVYDAVPKGRGEHNEVYVTHDTKMILGVNCVVVRDRVWVKGVVEEDTFDWYAQDRVGNVWHMGEDATQFKNGVVVGHSGSWEAGVNGAQPGYVMEAHPQVGDAYRQEWAT
jgi:hypothetical protein